jgi:hypothetical protein
MPIWVSEWTGAHGEWTAFAPHAATGFELLKVHNSDEQSR